MFWFDQYNYSILYAAILVFFYAKQDYKILQNPANCSNFLDNCKMFCSDFRVHCAACSVHYALCLYKFVC